ncbi:MAG: STAS domain-containing protein [Pseudomonadales bacterium]
MSVDPFELPRAVSFDSLVEVRQAGESYLDQSAGEAVFDLSPLVEFNSAVVALLMSWFRYAHACGRSIVYAGAPAELLSIIEVSGLSRILPLRG